MGVGVVVDKHRLDHLRLCRYHMQGAEAWCSQPLYYNRSCDLLERRSAALESSGASKGIGSFLSTSKSRRSRRRREKERRQKQQQQQGVVVELSRDDVQSYCK